MNEQGVREISDTQLLALQRNTGLSATIRNVVNAEWIRRSGQRELPAPTRLPEAPTGAANNRFPGWIYLLIVLLPLGFHPVTLSVLVAAYVHLLGRYRLAPALIRLLHRLIVLWLIVATLAVLGLSRAYFTGGTL